MPIRMIPGRKTTFIVARMLWLITLSAAANAWVTPSFGTISSPIRSLSKAITALAYLPIDSSASRACSVRRAPSNENGIVAKTTKKTPSSLAIRQTSGAAPEPVPPPRPTQIKMIPLSRTAARISSTASSAACFPREGSPPVPIPFKSVDPNWILLLETDVERALTSVFSVSSSASSLPSKAIRSSTLAPAPPTPITLTPNSASTGNSPWSNWLYSIIGLF